MSVVKVTSDNSYIIFGEMIIDDINFINRINIPTYITFFNTRYISSDMIKKINNSNIRISVVGGLDYFNKEKYDKDDYKKRNYYGVEEFSLIIEYFESIEKELDPEWDDVERCMYIYNALMQDTTYVEQFRDKDLSFSDIQSSLRGNLYHKLTCSGISLTFKELMDRQGIECAYQSVQHQHSFNIVKLKGKYRAFDLTWDINHYKGVSLDNYKYFGKQTKEEFRINRYHDISGESQEFDYEIEPFTDEEIINCHKKIEEKLWQRKKHLPAINTMGYVDKKRVLGYDKQSKSLDNEMQVLSDIKHLKKIGYLDDSNILLDFYNARYNLLSDLVRSSNYYFYSNNLSENELIRMKEDALNYVKKFIKNFFETFSVYMSSYEFISFDDDLEQNSVYFLVNTIVEFLMKHKELVIDLGYEEEYSYLLYKYKKEKIKEYDEKERKYPSISSSLYDDNLFQIDLINIYDLYNIKKIIEKKLNRIITKEELKKYFTNIEFMKDFFIDFSQFQFNEQEWLNVLTNRFNELIVDFDEFVIEQNNMQNQINNQVQNNDWDDFSFDDSEWSEFNLEDDQVHKFF